MRFPTGDNRPWRIGLFLLLLAAIVIYSRTFFIPHNSGDQPLYAALAMKLDNGGMAEYSLRGVATSSENQIVTYSPTTEMPGDLVASLRRRGTAFYDQPLFHQPPLFPLLLTISHHVLSSGQPYQTIGGRYGPVEISAEPFLSQYSLVLVPLLSALLLIMAVYLLGTVLAGESVGCVAALLIVVSPAVAQSAQRLWADASLALAVTLSMLFLHLFAEQKRLVFAALSAAALGAALLLKNAALLAVVPLAFYWILMIVREPRRAHVWQGLLVFIVVVVAITVWWAVTLTRVYGSPLFTPSSPGLSQMHPWFEYLKAKPWYTYLVEVPWQVPVFLLGYWAVALMVLAREKSPGQLLLAVWVVAFMAGLTLITARNELLGPEHRYLIPAYPALAVLSAMQLERIGKSLRQRWPVVLGVGLSAVWSVWLIWHYRNFDVLDVLFR